MSLLERLRLKRKQEKSEFIDEDLTIEEIFSKTTFEIDCNKVQLYLSKLSPQKRNEYQKYVLEKSSRAMERVDQRCLEKYGMRANEYYDVEHPSDY